MELRTIKLTPEEAQEAVKGCNSLEEQINAQVKALMRKERETNEQSATVEPDSTGS